MERLTKRITEATIELSAKANPFQYNGSPQRVQPKHPFWNIFDRLCKYEDAEEQGFLIRLPVPIGTKKLFYIEKGYVYELDATRLSISKFPVSDEIIYEYDFCEFSFDDFGKIVFLTEEEAKAALAEKGGV